MRVLLRLCVHSVRVHALSSIALCRVCVCLLRARVARPYARTPGAAQAQLARLGGAGRKPAPFPALARSRAASPTSSAPPVRGPIPFPILFFALSFGLLLLSSVTGGTPYPKGGPSGQPPPIVGP